MEKVILSKELVNSVQVALHVHHTDSAIHPAEADIRNKALLLLDRADVVVEIRRA